MARILLSKHAPEGQPLSAAFGPYRFDAGDADYYETDDEAMLAEVEAHPFFDVDRSDSKGDENVDPKAQARAAQRERKAIEKAKMHDATKDPRDPNWMERLEDEGQDTPEPTNDPAVQTAEHDKTQEGNG